MDTENSNVITQNKTLQLPKQQVQLPLISLPTSTRLLRPADMMLYTEPTMLYPQDMPLRLSDEAYTTWGIADAIHKVVWQQEFTYAYLQKVINELDVYKMQNFHLATDFTLVFQIEIHQSMQHSGLLALSWRPGADIDSFITELGNRDRDPLRKLFYLTPLMLTPQENKAYEMEIPIRGHFLHYFNGMGNLPSIKDYVFGRIKLEVLSKLNTVSEVTNLPIKISKRFGKYIPQRVSGRKT